jgi:hypothetical protein
LSRVQTKRRKRQADSEVKKKKKWSSIHLPVHFYLDLENNFTLQYFDLRKAGETGAGKNLPKWALNILQEVGEKRLAP